MKSPSKLLLIATLISSLSFARASSAITGLGQPGFGGQTITCSSDNGSRNYCNADTRGGVRLTRQISGSPCSQGQTWGWDNRGIWVDRGCRAEFVTGSGGNWGPGGGQGNQRITCSSNDGRRNFCNVDTRGGVQLTRQISGSPCSQGQTWGWDNRGIWVDRGCRAEFVTGAGGNAGSGGANNRFRTITCSSDNGNRNSCPLPFRVNPNNVFVSRQISGSACTRGSSWGVDNRGIWVDRGCRAEFGFR